MSVHARRIDLNRFKPLGLGVRPKVRLSRARLLAGLLLGLVGSVRALAADSGAPPLLITELMAQNRTTLSDEDGDSSDWIELYNNSEESLNLGGWYLSDDALAPGKWALPSLELNPTEFLILFASEKNRTNSAGTLHTNFKLGAEGGFLGLARSASGGPRFVQSYNFLPPRSPDESYGLSMEGNVVLSTNAVRLFPTPAQANPAYAIDVSPGPVSFSRAGGLFTGSFWLALSEARAGADIHYELVTNAQPALLATGLPSTNSPRYNGPIWIDRPVEVRTRAFAPLPGPPRSEIFIPLGRNLRPFVSSLPLVVVHTFGAGKLSGEAAIHGCVEFFDNESGHASLTNRGTPIRASIQVLRRRTTDPGKPSLRVELMNEFGQDAAVSVLGLPKDSAWVLYAPSALDPGLLSNPLAHQFSRVLGRYAPRTRFVELFLGTDGQGLNDQYVGVYVLEEEIKRGRDRVPLDSLTPASNTEPELSGGYLLEIAPTRRSEARFRGAGWLMDFKYPSDSEMLDPLRLCQRQYLQNYFNLFSNSLPVRGAPPATGTNHYSFYFDVDTAVDYHLVNVLTMNPLALREEVSLFKPRAGPLTLGPVENFDRALGGGDRRSFNPRRWRPMADKRGTDFFNQSPVWARLFRDPDFFQRWIDRYQDLRENAWQTNLLVKCIDDLADEVREAQPRDQARWRAHRPRRGSITVSGYTHTFDGAYTGEVAFLKRWLFDRLSFMDSQFLSRPALQFLAPNQVAMLDRSGSAGTRIYYTLDGSDPRLPGNGTNGHALLYSGPITVEQAARVVARAVNGSSFPGGLTGPNNPPLRSFWSGRAELTVTAASSQAISLSELMYHPPAPPRGSPYGRDEFQFIELKNLSPRPVRLEGCQFTDGVRFTFPSLTLAPDAYVLVVKNRAAFASRYGTNLPVAGQFQGNLASSGERLSLVDVVGHVIFSLDYSNLWYPLTDGPGLALVPVSEASPPAQRSDWRAGLLLGGSPGRPEPEALPVVPVVINELLSSPAPPYEDMVELYNPNATAADISYWYLTDDQSEPRKFQMPPGTVLPAFGYWALDEHAFNPFSNPPLPGSFSFNAKGDAVYLYSANAAGELTGYVHGFRFGPASADVAFGRVILPEGDEAFLPEEGFSFGEGNRPPAAFTGAALRALQFTEVMYNPGSAGTGTSDAQEYEFVELHNSGGVPLDLTRVELTGAVRFTFANWVLPPDGYVLLVRNAQLFASRYGSNLPVAGEYAGGLSKDGESLYLSSAQGEPLAFTSYSPTPVSLYFQGWSLVPAAPGGGDGEWRLSHWAGGSPGTAEPPATAWLPVLINETLAASEHSSGFVELYNPNEVWVSIGGWELFDGGHLTNFPAGTLIPPRGFWVFWDPFFDSQRKQKGSEVTLLARDPITRRLTGYADYFGSGIAADGFSRGRHRTTDGREVFSVTTLPTPGAPNAPPQTGPLILTEIRPSVPTNLLGTVVRANPDDQYVELQNVTHEALSLNGWKLRGDINFDFRPGSVAPSNGTLLVVGFDPGYWPAAQGFRARNSVPPVVPLFGPWSGTLRANEAVITLTQPVALPYLTRKRHWRTANGYEAQTDTVHYQDRSPWPATADLEGQALSLQRIDATRYGDDPSNWRAGARTPGVSAFDLSPPRILNAPQSQAVPLGKDITLNVSAAGAGPLYYLWHFNGAAILDATNSTLTLHSFQASQAGSYTVRVANPLGSILSPPAALTVSLGLAITRQPTNVFIRIRPDPAAAPSTNAVFQVAAADTASVTYQWRFNGTNLPGATNASLIVSNVSVNDDGFYSCALTKFGDTTDSAPARLVPLVSPRFTFRPFDQIVPVGATVTVGAAVSGHPPPFQFEWRSLFPPLFTNVYNQASNSSFWTFPAPTNLGSSRFYAVVVRNEADPFGIAATFIVTTPLDTNSNRLSPQSPFVVTNLLRPDFWDTDGTINAVAAAHGVVYVGGNFSYVAPKGRKAAAVDAYTGEASFEFPEIAGGSVEAILSDENGGWWIGGSFTSVGGVPQTNLVHLYSNLSVDPDFHPDPNGTVRALTLAGGFLYLGGDFTSVAGQPRGRLAALDAASGALVPWNPGANDSVATLFLAHRTLYAGGRFTRIGSVDQGYLAAFDLDADRLLSFAPALDGEVLAIGLLDDRVFLGGNFNRAGGTTRNGLAAVDAVTGTVLPWDPNPIGNTNLVGGKVTSLRVSCNAVYVGGFFTNIAGVERHRVAALDPFTATATPWDARLGLFRSGTLSSSIKAIELSGNTLYLGGNFNAAAGQNRTDLIAVEAGTGELLAWNPGLDGGINTLAVAGRTLLAGLATGPGGRERQNLAAFDELTGRAIDWNPGADNPVLALAVSGNVVYAGGSFTHVGGEPHSRLAAIDADSGEVLSSWMGSANNTVQALALASGTLYAGGKFTSMNAFPRRRLAALSAATGQLQLGWSNSVDGPVYALAASSDTLYVGGNFSAINNSNCLRLGALDLAGGQIRPWAGTLDTPEDAFNAAVANTLALSGSTLYVGVYFSAANQAARHGLAAFAAGSGLLQPWASAVAGEVRALAVAGDQIIAGGSFLAAGSQPRFGLVAFSPDGSLLDWNPSVSVRNQVLALAFSERALYVGGPSGLAFEQASAGQTLAVFPRTGAPRITRGPASVRAPAAGSAVFDVDADGVEPLDFRWRFNDVDLPGATGTTLLLTNLTASQSGRYTVVVSNVLGAATAEASLVVLAPVGITNQPVSQTVAPGATVSLSVGATGSPPPIYQWRLNGINIPGAVYSTLVLSNVTPASGGTYSVAVANSSGVTYSDDARVVVTAPPLPWADSFANRGSISGIAGTGSGNNAGFTNELSEPRHAGKPGGHSGWLEWLAPTNGIATFSTRGSGFDTLLGIYTNDTLASLGAVTADEDRGGFLTSRAAFNAVRGVRYQIAIDGVGDESGDIVLSWEMEVNAPELPTITAQPLPQSVTLNSTAFFSVGALSSVPLTFQWFLGCQEIRGATNATLIITNVQLRHVGLYHVVITSATGRSSESLPAALEIGPIPGARSYDKLADLLDALGAGARGGGGGGGRFGPASLGGPSPLLISLGPPLAQYFNTSSNGPAPKLTSACGAIVGANSFLDFTQAVDGLVVMDTIDSSFDTLLVVFDFTSYAALTNSIVACDDNNAPDGIRSWLSFHGLARHRYLASVSGVAGASGRAQINWRIVPPPRIVGSNSNLTARLGTGVLLHTGVLTSNETPVIQWFLNGVALAGATNQTLSLSSLRPDEAGRYQVTVRNHAGSVTNSVALLQIRLPLRLENTHWDPLGRFAFQIQGEPNAFFSVETSSDLRTWSVLQTGRLVEAVVTFTESNAPAGPARFYRLVEPDGDQ